MILLLLVNSCKESAIEMFLMSNPKIKGLNIEWKQYDSFGKGNGEILYYKDKLVDTVYFLSLAKNFQDEYDLFEFHKEYTLNDSIFYYRMTADLECLYFFKQRRGDEFSNKLNNKFFFCGKDEYLKLHGLLPIIDSILSKEDSIMIFETPVEIIP